jgi:hypothetical protein
MTSITFESVVRNGQLTHGESLAPFEGKRVYVTVIAPQSPPSPSNGHEDEGAEGLDVEKDLYAPMKPQTQRRADMRIVNTQQGKPCIILPEELPDE